MWSGGLTPMNHLDQVTPLSFDITYQDDELAMVLGGPEGIQVPIRNARVDGDTLRFAFNEPEVGVELNCALAKGIEPAFEGRCADETGKWALVTMNPPSD